MNKERGKELVKPIEDPITNIEKLIKNIKNPIANIENIENIEKLIENTKNLIENIKNPRVNVELILQDRPNNKNKKYLNKLAFLFNEQAPGAIHGATEVETLDKSCRLIVSVDKAQFEEFKKYIRETDLNIICLLAVGK